MKKGIIAGAVTGIIVLLVAALFINNTKPHGTHPWKLLPDTPALIIETQNPYHLFEKLKYGNDIWNSLTKIGTFKQIEAQTEYLDSLLKGNTEYHTALFSSPLLIAFYGDSLNTQALFVSSIGSTPDLENIKQFIAGKAKNSSAFVAKQESGFPVLKIVNGRTDFAVTIGFAGEMAVISKSESLVLKALNTYGIAPENHFSSSKIFTKIQKTAGKHVNTHLYVNGPKLGALLPNFIEKNRKQPVSAVLNRIEWSVTDLFLRKNELILNGLSIGDINQTSYRNLLNQKPQPQDYIGYLPYNTTLFLFRGYSNFTAGNSTTPDKYGSIDIEALSKLIGNQIVFASTARTANEFDEKSFVMVRFNDKTEAQKIFKRSAQKSGQLTVSKYNNYTINKLSDGAFTESLFGAVFKDIRKNYYVFVDDYAIVGNSAKEIINLLRLYETGKTLDLNENFKSFSNRLTRLSNLTIYLKTSELTGMASRYFNSTLSGRIKVNSASIKDFSGVIFQMSNQFPYLYTGLYLKQSTTHHQENLALWRVKLDDDIVSEPYPVKDHTTGKRNIIVFDKSNKVYLIRYDGVILWKKQLSGTPVSSVFQVDYFKNRKIQYLFNTSDYIYLFDKNGKNVKQYPIRINPSATNGLNVFDYSNKRDYRILLAQSDKRIYNYSIKGRKIKGWKSFKMNDIVIKPVQHLVANHKDYLIVSDINNRIKIVNRKGQERIKIKGKLNKAVNSEFYVNKTNSKGIFITTNQQGKLVYLSATGKLRYTDFGNFSPQHFFLYDDFNSDGTPDFIYVDKNKLTVFNRFKKVLFSYTFNSDIRIKPAFFKLGKNKKVLGIVSDLEHNIYLFDKNGNISISKELMGDTPFTITSLQNNREVNLITGAGNMLLNYKIK